MNSSIIKQITLSGMLTSVAILVGSFLHFPLFGGQLYLISMVTFIMPLFLKIDILLISTIFSVVIVDVISGYGAYAWISALAYGASAIILWFFKKINIKFIYLLGVLLASIAIVSIYFLLELKVFGLSLALMDAASTSLEMLIALIFVSSIYRPLNLLKV